MEKVFGPAQSEVLKLNFRGISPLRRAKRWMDFLSSSAGWRLASRPRIKRRQHDHHGRRGHAKRKAEPRAFWFWLGNLDVRLFVHEFRVKRGCAIRYAKIYMRQGIKGSASQAEPLHKWLRQTRRTHARLHRRDVVRNAPELHNPVLHIGDGKARARVSVARLSDGSRIQQIATARLRSQWRKCFRKPGTNV